MANPNNAKNVVNIKNGQLLTVMNNITTTSPLCNSYGLGNYIPSTYTSPLFFATNTDVSKRTEGGVNYITFTYAFYLISNVGTAPSLADLQSLLLTLQTDYSSYLSLYSYEDGTSVALSNGYKIYGVKLKYNLDAMNLPEDACCNIVHIQGQDGSSGTSGFGSSGSSGASGVNGSAGQSGSSGSSGTSAVGVTSGSAGSSGTSAVGSSGSSGVNGSSGSSGTNGTSGSSGVNGSSGTNGTSGSSATSGSAGSSGLTPKYQGNSTDTFNLSSLTPGNNLTVNTTPGLEYTTNQFIQVTNSFGNSIHGVSVSYNVITGVLILEIDSIEGTGTFSSWITNLDGAAGGDGTSGSSGSSGTSGSSGANGSSGSSGTNGTSGSSGSSGGAGTSGSSGINGTSGSSGSSGVNGISGSSGSSGANGSNGSSGTNGTSGSSGGAGTSGSSGANGTGASTSSVNTWTAAQGGEFVNLTDASTIAVDSSLGNNFKVILGGNRILGVPTNVAQGRSGVINVWQDGTGSRLLAYSWCYKFGNGNAPVLTVSSKYVMDQLTYMINNYATSSVTISNATPGVVTWPSAHGLNTGMVLQLTTSGTLPTGLSPATTYWINVTGTTTFNLATSKANLDAGTYIATSSAGSGTHTATSMSITITIINNIS